MKRLPRIALVGRPNVGKSSLFNRIAKKRIAIVDEAEGITRDRLYTEVEVFGQKVEIIDTGGIDPRSKLPFNEEVRRQAEIAIEEADGVILVVDGTVGVTILDEEVANFLLRSKKRVCLAVNKIDDRSKISQFYPFRSLGFEDMVPVSATQGFQIVELLEVIMRDLPSFEEEEEEFVTKVAIVGCPNVGKSTLLNYLLQEERCVVSPIAGTTRDSIDSKVIHEGKEYLFIDTAGIRRSSANKEVVDKFAMLRTERAIERADICLLMVDASQGITEREKKIASDIERAKKGCIVLLNKWDLVEGFRMEHCLQSLRENIPFLQYAPILFISAKSGRNVPKVLAEIDHVYGEFSKRVSTGQLNQILEKALQRCPPPSVNGKRLRIYYMAQVSASPPKMVLFVNSPDLLSSSYKRYLIGQLRKVHPFRGTPLSFHIKGRKAPK